MPVDAITTGKMAGDIAMAAAPLRAQRVSHNEQAARLISLIAARPERLAPLQFGEATLATGRTLIGTTTALAARTDMKDAHLSAERHIWACANTLLQQHGDDAWFHASQRADELLLAGEMEGHRTYLRILDRIKKLEALKPDGTVQ